MQTYKIVYEHPAGTNTAFIKARNKFDAVRILVQYFEDGQLTETIVNVEEVL